MTGYFVVPRGTMNHPVFGTPARQQFDWRSAYLWLIEHACYVDTVTSVGPVTVVLKRGQLTFSLRYLAGAWGWSVEKVRRFLGRLVGASLIETASETPQLLLTICNYDAFSLSASLAETPNETPDETATRQQRDSNETNINKESKESNIITLERKKEPPAGGDPLDLNALLFGPALQWLVGASGKSDATMRGFLASCLRDYGTAATLVAITKTRKSGAGEPISRIKWHLKKDAKPVEKSINDAW